MIKYALTLLFASFISLLYCQENYIVYHQRIRAIESSILDSNYTNVIQNYKQVFTDYDFIFAEDCFRAAQVATYINDTINAFYFLEKASGQGVTIDFIKKDSLLAELIDSPYWDHFLVSHDSLRKIYLSNINWELRYIINDLNTLDQKFRDKHQEHPWNILWRPFIWLAWKHKTQIIVEDKLIPIIEEFGFPNEKLIGLDEKWMLDKQQKDGITSNYAFIILIHYFSIPRPKTLNNTLYKEIDKGNISPHQYASLIDFQAEWGKKKYYKGLHYNEWHSTKVKDELKQIEINRFQIGLETLQDRKRKRKRGLAACKKRKKGNYKHIRFWMFCG